MHQNIISPSQPGNWMLKVTRKVDTYWYLMCTMPLCPSQWFCMWLCPLMHAKKADFMNNVWLLSWPCKNWLLARCMFLFNLPFTSVSLCMCFVHTSLLCNKKPSWTQHICSCATAKREIHHESYSNTLNIMTMKHRYLETLCFLSTT